uniref:WXG100 family type VII secretion target n=1 Tax=Saccharopolyspora oryzae TaxID=2997343 RepID=UPI0038CD481B
MTNPLIAERKDSTQSFSGVPILESVDETKKAIESGDWASGVMGAVGTGLDALTMALDPFGSILAAGVGWLMEHVGPLSDALDALTGDADQIKAHSETWKNVATELGEINTEMANMVNSDVADWSGAAADSYRQRSEDTGKLIEAAKKAAEGASDGIGTAGEVVAAVRTLVRDIIAELVGRLISWALQVLATLGIAMAWVVPQVVAAVAKTVAKIADVTTKLVKAMKALSPLIKKLKDGFGDAGKALKKIKNDNGTAPKPNPTPPPSRGGNGPRGGQESSRGMREDSDSSPGSTIPQTNSAPQPSPTTSASTGGNTSAPPASSAPTQPTGNTPQPTVLTGNISDGKGGKKPHSVTPDKVQSIPLKDDKGNTVGISFPSKAEDPKKVGSWAGKPIRNSDNWYNKNRNSKDSNFPETKADAPWKGKQPFYVHAHAQPKGYIVNVNTAQPGQPAKWEKMGLTGDQYGQLVSSNSHFQAASKADPNRPIVQMSCQAGSPAGNAAQTSADAIRNAGHSGDVYAPTGKGFRKPDGNESIYGVGPGVDSSGNPVAGEFKKF